MIAVSKDVGSSRSGNISRYPIVLIFYFQNSRMSSKRMWVAANSVRDRLMRDGGGASI